MINEEDITSWADIFKALGHPTRLSIVIGLIEHNECNVNKMVENLGLSQSNISQHLALLRRVGIVKCEKKAQVVCYRVENAAVREIIKKICKLGL
ncbi:MAG TPA: metalloregulator ArsR/SmtB family transcription factor [Spirochaetota bacterium]|nr:metalloregulator ArsR/SmtB family transcription factor [Spirochaetota bacterium]